MNEEDVVSTIPPSNVENKIIPPLTVDDRTKEGKLVMPTPSPIQTIKDLANRELQKPVSSRMRTRYKQILEMSRAKSSKIMKGNQPVWTTINPQMFISGLKLSTKNGVGVISYHKYELDEKGNKKATVHTKKIINSRGDTVEVEVSISYRHQCLVVEMIEYMKKIKVEEIKEFV